ncbi:GGDEF domain-containing protein [Paenibacillus segetis]|uniref:GGDEF domain-containing protein n=1 Tax=Paenibacillus segetis TaxID=1325360 RepID=A0ABQ1Y4Q3_9BACL|nr:GGDEF domain-containing protein [Paenibacillus segetis]GGH11790.1 hypothetical protein GCM10008013_03800 [Paenibacillus segetis]
MEELQVYIFAVLSLVVAALVVILIEKLIWGVASKNRNVKVVRGILTGLLLGAGIWCMHLLNSQSLSTTNKVETGIVYPLLVYLVTIGLLLLLSFLLRSRLAESANLRDLAYRDSLTGLLNSNGMNDFWDRCKGTPKLAVLFLDLNRFKSINDSLGHHVGDMLLKEVGADLSQFTRKNRRHIFRIGGDEFVIISKNCGQKEAERLAVTILEKITKNYVLDQHELFVSGSIGITLSTGKVDRTRLLKEADSAMYSAKQLGTGRYYLYKQSVSN